MINSSFLLIALKREGRLGELLLTGFTLKTLNVAGVAFSAIVTVFYDVESLGGEGETLLLSYKLQGRALIDDNGLRARADFYAVANGTIF